MFLSPFSFTWPTPSLFLFLQMSCCTEEVYILSCSKPKPSPTPQNYSSDFFPGSGCIWCFYLNTRWKQLSNRLLFYISSHSSLHLSHFSPSHSLSRSGSRALPFSTWWESCFIYTFLFFFHLSLHLYLHLPDNVQHFPLNSYFRSCISVGHNAVMASIKYTQFSDTLWLNFK